jgi:hypothetical protein
MTILQERRLGYTVSQIGTQTFRASAPHTLLYKGRRIDAWDLTPLLSSIIFVVLKESNRIFTSYLLKVHKINSQCGVMLSRMFHIRNYHKDFDNIL